MVRKPPEVEALASVSLEGYRVFRKRTEIPFGRLTLLAGANSSGKSSAMHALLLLKQTLDAPFDPGPLLLSGDHVSLASFDDARSRGSSGPITFGFTTTRKRSFDVALDQSAKGKGDIEVSKQYSRGERGRATTLSPGTRWNNRRVDRRRFLLGTPARRTKDVYVPSPVADAVATFEHLLHVPGLRTPPLRDYPVTAIGDSSPGRFDHYVASVLFDWHRTKDRRLGDIGDDLAALGLTWKVRPRRKSDTQLAIDVGRLRKPLRGGGKDFVEIADVGVGVSQVLPVLVALRHAKPGQLVYLEQPELHLHPRAQTSLARILTTAAARGVRVVVETHSSLLLLGIQAIVASGQEPKLPPQEVQLNWFERSDSGDAVLSTSRLDDTGAFGSWPQDFDATELEAQAAYLDAVERKAR